MPVAFDQGPSIYLRLRSKDQLQVNITSWTALLWHTKYSMLFWYFIKHSKENFALIPFTCSYIVHALFFFRDSDLDCNVVHVPYVWYHNNVTLGNGYAGLSSLEIQGQDEWKKRCPDKLVLGLRRSVIINNKSTWKNDRKSHFINKCWTPIKRQPQKNARSKLRFLNKHQGHLTKKIWCFLNFLCSLIHTYVSDFQAF